MPELEEKIRIGIIQTSLDYIAAWRKHGPPMAYLEEQKAITEIKRAFRTFVDNGQEPNITLLPELSVPLGFRAQLRRLAESLKTVVIAGIDYRVRGDQVTNEGILIVPKRWGPVRLSRRTTSRYFGKAYPAAGEKRLLGEVQLRFKSCPEIFVFDFGRFGRFGVAICFDLMDLQRLAMYRTEIQHLFVLAYNQDLTSFQHIAQAAARTIYCNVVICNTGYFGGSVAIAPAYDPKERILFQHQGPRLFTCQVFEMPVAPLKLHQEGGASSQWKGKALPPGFAETVRLKMLKEKIGG